MLQPVELMSRYPGPPPLPPPACRHDEDSGWKDYWLSLPERYYTGLSFPPALVQSLAGTAAQLEIQRAQAHLRQQVRARACVCAARRGAAAIAAALMSAAALPVNAAAKGRQPIDCLSCPIHYLPPSHLLYCWRRSTPTRAPCLTCCWPRIRASCAPSGLTTTATCGLPNSGTATPLRWAQHAFMRVLAEGVVGCNVSITVFRKPRVVPLFSG